VFRGTLDDGKVVAIKRASEQSLQGTVEFRNEVLLLSRLHHRHLVRLEGFCDDKGLQVLAAILFVIFNMLNFPNSFISITNLLENESTNMGG